MCLTPHPPDSVPASQHLLCGLSTPLQETRSPSPAHTLSRSFRVSL